MLTKIIIILLVIIFLLFFLSVMAPMHSDKKFWIAIYKIRSVMDFLCYWFFNLCGIATILYVVGMVIYDLTKG